MGLYALGKTAAIAAIEAAVDARVVTGADGFKSVDLQSLHQWLYEQANTIISSDVAAPNKEAARGVLTTIDVVPYGNRLTNAYTLSTWRDSPDFPSTAALSRSQSFVDAVVGAKQELERVAAAIEADYVQIANELPQVLSAVYAENNIADGMPPVEDRVVETRFYVYTHVNDIGEESAPSPVSEMVELDQRDTVNLSIVAAPSGRNIDRWRFYRSNVGTQNAAFQFISEGPIGTTSGTDAMLSSQLGEVIPTTTWAEPPSGLRGLVNMPNGVMAGYVDNYVAFCEPFVAYAWPVEYQITTEFPIVALGVFGQTLVVFHKGGVDYISGADSASMSMQKDVSKQACISPRSVVEVDGGVVFASADGLCLASQQGVQVLTAGKINRQDWQALGLTNAHCAYSEGTVYLYGLALNKIWYMNLPTGKIGEVTFAQDYSAVYVDRTTDSVYGANGTNVFKLFSLSPPVRVGVWKSKVQVVPSQTGFAWLAVESDFADGPVTVRWYGDGVLRYTATVASRVPVRLPVGRWLEHEIEVEGSSRLNKVTLASSGDELRAA